MDIIERDIFSVICRNDGIKAKSIAKEIGKERSVVNHYLYRSAFIKDCAIGMIIICGTVL